MENRYSWQRMAVALFDRATARLGEDARQLQDAVSWTSRGRPGGIDAGNEAPLAGQWQMIPPVESRNAPR